MSQVVVKSSGVDSELLTYRLFFLRSFVNDPAVCFDFCTLVALTSVYPVPAHKAAWHNFHPAVQDLPVSPCSDTAVFCPYKMHLTARTGTIQRPYKHSNLAPYCARPGTDPWRL